MIDELFKKHCSCNKTNSSIVCDVCKLRIDLEAIKYIEYNDPKKFTEILCGSFDKDNPDVYNVRVSVDLIRDQIEANYFITGIEIDRIPERDNIKFTMYKRRPIDVK